MRSAIWPLKPGFDYLSSVAVVTVATLISVSLRSRLPLTNFAMVYLFGVVAISVRCARGAAIFTAFLSVTAFYYFCIPVHNSFVLEDYTYIITLVAMLAVALVISTLTARIRLQAADAIENERRTRALYRLSSQLSKQTSASDAARIGAQTTADVFDARVDIVVRDENGVPVSIGSSEIGSVPQTTLLAAQAVLENGRASSSIIAATDHKMVAIPMVCSGAVLAAMILAPRDAKRFGHADQAEFLAAFSGQVAAAMERAQASAAVHDAELTIQTERIRNSLLSAVSHDIKTPISSIYGAATSFLEEEHRLGQIDRRRLVESISKEAERLNRLVTNLLEMTHLDAGIQLKRDWYMLEDLVGTALARVENILDGRPLTTEIPANLPLIWVDGVLIEGLFVNVLENAIKYTPPGTPLKIIAGRGEGTLSISILDNGPGFEPGDEARIFDKFFRSKTDGKHGVGLGLAICRAIVRVHDGSIRAANRAEGGAAIYIELPIGGKPPDVESIPESALS